VALVPGPIVIGVFLGVLPGLILRRQRATRPTVPRGSGCGGCG
jgi:hypothetical protein